MPYPAYPKYKASGVEWLGDVPEHWETPALKRKFKIVNGGTLSSSEESYWDGDIVWITPDDLGREASKRIAKGRRSITTEGLANCGVRLVPENSMIISTRVPIGHLAITDIEGCTNQGCRALVPFQKDIDSDYFYFTLLASKPVLQASGKGTTFLELSTTSLGQQPIPLPPIAEQHAIADYLDRETGRLDTLVAKKRTLVERLKEKRTALISQTVTQGLPAEAARAAGFDPHPWLALWHRMARRCAGALGNKTVKI